MVGDLGKRDVHEHFPDRAVYLREIREFRTVARDIRRRRDDIAGAERCPDVGHPHFRAFTLRGDAPVGTDDSQKQRIVRGDARCVIRVDRQALGVLERDAFAREFGFQFPDLSGVRWLTSVDLL